MRNRRPKFLIVLAVAALTFGGLMKTIGRNHFQHRCCPTMEQCEKEKTTNDSNRYNLPEK